MNLKRCENNHYYDAGRYDSCPHCQQSNGSEVTVAFDQEPPAAVPNDCAGNRPGADPNTIPQSMGSSLSQQFTVPDSLNGISGGGSLADSISQANTMPYEEESVTVGIYSPIVGKEPVVGWLVCIQGCYFGESFRLKTGRNFIGRSQKMDVVLANDNSVSRDKHAIIVYEPRRREFIAQAGESRELFYLNDEVVLGGQKIKGYDVLTVGKTKLMFFPCCGENFGWDDFTEQEDEAK